MAAAAADKSDKSARAKRSVSKPKRHFHLRMDEEVAELLEQRAAEMDRSMCWLINKLVADAVAE